MTAEQLTEGYWRAYRDFYRWSAIWHGASTKDTLRGRLRHVAYSCGWKKFEPLWDVAIRTGQVLHALPLLEAVLSAFGERAPKAAGGSGRGRGRGLPGDVAVGVLGVQADDRRDGDQGERDQGYDQHPATGAVLGRR